FTAAAQADVEYDTRRSLATDPLILFYSTYHGSENADLFGGLAVDPRGNLIVLGQKSSVASSVGTPRQQNHSNAAPYDLLVSMFGTGGPTPVNGKILFISSRDG